QSDAVLLAFVAVVIVPIERRDLHPHKDVLVQTFVNTNTRVSRPEGKPQACPQACEERSLLRTVPSPSRKREGANRVSPAPLSGLRRGRSFPRGRNRLPACGRSGRRRRSCGRSAC